VNKIDSNFDSLDSDDEYSDSNDLSLIMHLKEHNQSGDFEKKCIEYAAVMELISQIAVSDNRRDVIGRIKSLFLDTFQAGFFHYIEIDKAKESDHTIGELEIEYQLIHSELPYILDEKRNCFYIKMIYKDSIVGVARAGGFKRSEDIEKYLYFAVVISRICGLTISNINQYEILKKTEGDFEYLSYHDSLTGLYNRAFAMKVIEEISECVNTGVFYFDIDGLKKVNDKHGHMTGDILIKSAADILKRCFRENDMVARIGGDEFITILKECDSSLAEMIKKRLIAMVKAENEKENRSRYALSISIGYAIGHDDSDTMEKLIRHADRLMYQNKMEKYQTV